MVKKIVIAGLFLGVGYFFIKKVLPKFNKPKSDMEFELEEYEVKRSIINLGGGSSETYNPNQLGGNQSATNILSMEGSVRNTNRGGINYNKPIAGKINAVPL